MSFREIGRTGNGAAVHEIVLTLASGARASILTYGAILRDLELPFDGALRRVVLGYRDLGSYLADRSFMGAICGRNANRIAQGRFRLDGVDYRLAGNGANGHHIHGGPTGFSKQVWSVVEYDDSFVTLELTSLDGHEGYPGTVVTRCTFRLVAPSDLCISLTAQTDAPTPINLAHHSYFTLQSGATSRDHLLQVNAEGYTAVDADNNPTGDICSVEGSAYDFRAPIRIGDRMGDKLLDMNFVLRSNDGLAARVWSPDHSIEMAVFTSEPGMQIYDGANLKPAGPGLDGQDLRPFAGLCLEPQKFPNAINRPEFPSPVVRPGETYSQATRYCFSSREA